MRYGLEKRPFLYTISSYNIHVADVEEATKSPFRLNAPLEFVWLHTDTC